MIANFRIIGVAAALGIASAMTATAQSGPAADGSAITVTTQPADDVGGSPLRYRATFLGGGASREFNPYLLTVDNYGRTPMAGTAAVDVAVVRHFDLSRRFSWEAGAEGVGGYASKTDYMRYEAVREAWISHREGMPAAWIQQLYAGVKWRGVFLTVGQKEYRSPLVNPSLSSGDLVSGSGSRPVAQVRAGFVDFQDIPFTKGWVQIQGSLSYGKLCDGEYLKHHYNYWNEHITLGSLYTYKNIHFRSNPSKPLSVMIGIQSAGIFGGTTYHYYGGKETSSKKNKQDLRAFWEMIIPSKNNGDGYVEGSTLGSWDFRARYRMNGGHEVAGYFQWLWEDGSSMGRRNKWDGLWGIAYERTGGRHLLQNAVAEYIDFRDQSGPLHWAPGDAPGTDITTEATGGDDYYNNTTQNGYAHFGMSMGTSFVKAPIYNTDGYLQFRHTRSRGFHLGASGWLAPTVSWRALVSHAVAWGSGRYHENEALHNTSALLGAGWDAARILPGLSTTAALSFDTGELRGHNFGALFTVTYSGIIALDRK